jgi:hypothetical protein
MVKVTISCEPQTIGAKTAVLSITSNDADEVENTYDLNCHGIDPPVDEVIFDDGFED